VRTPMTRGEMSIAIGESSLLKRWGFNTGLIGRGPVRAPADGYQFSRNIRLHRQSPPTIRRLGSNYLTHPIICINISNLNTYTRSL
jgi:hypothetical protein